MQRKSNLKQIASALFENQPSSNVQRHSGKMLPPISEGLKRKGESDAYTGRSRSDASSDDVDRLSLRSLSIDPRRSNATEDEDEAEFFDCEDEERSKRLSVEGPPTKRKNDNKDNKHLLTRIQGPSRLRYWDSADHLGVPRSTAESI